MYINMTSKVQPDQRLILDVHMSTGSQSTTFATIDLRLCFRLRPRLRLRLLSGSTCFLTTISHFLSRLHNKLPGFRVFYCSKSTSQVCDTTAADNNDEYQLKCSSHDICVWFHIYIYIMPICQCKALVIKTKKINCCLPYSVIS